MRYNVQQEQIAHLSGNMELVIAVPSISNISISRSCYYSVVAALLLLKKDWHLSVNMLYNFEESSSISLIIGLSSTNYAVDVRLVVSWFPSIREALATGICIAYLLVKERQ